jgi:hypothetical protein
LAIGTRDERSFHATDQRSASYLAAIIDPNEIIKNVTTFQRG